jgi:3-methylfumaryl-CoA hydratase
VSVGAAVPEHDTDLRAWIGRRETAHDTVGATPWLALNATLDRPPTDAAVGTPLPPLWHWLYFLPLHRQSELGPDGHAQRGGFLPPVPLPRRMWAGSQFEFHAPLRIGDPVTRTSTIVDVATKQGRRGALVFVKVHHQLRREGADLPALDEYHDIVYRAARQPGEADPALQPAPSGAPWQRTVVPDAVLLFRYSALTFNGHRIHYDRPYATGIEGYPGLVVHGPLIATLLIDLLRLHRPDADVASFRFKAVRPAFDGHPLTLKGALQDDRSTVLLWAQDHEGGLVMDATATLR